MFVGGEPGHAHPQRRPSLSAQSDTIKKQP